MDKTKHEIKRIGVFSRITSYNVCYTKLLRFGEQVDGEVTEVVVEGEPLTIGLVLA